MNQFEGGMELEPWAYREGPFCEECGMPIDPTFCQDGLCMDCMREREEEE